MRDFVTLDIRAAENKKRLFECRDSKEETGYKMLVTVAATHSGIVNGNMRFYRPDRMRESLHTWTPKNRIPAPVLIHHDKHGPCVGRVMAHMYVDLTPDLMPQFSDLRNNFFCDAKSSRKLTIFESVDWIVANLQDKLEDYEGLGYTELGLKVTDPDAIRKVQDGEFMGVSVGFGSDAGVCSICHTDWAKDSQCEHKPGRRYSGKLAFLITGRHINREVSFVNFPADAFARVKNHEALAAMADSVATRVFFFGLPLRRQAEVVEAGLLEQADGLNWTADIELVTEAEMELNIDELIAKTKGELVKDSALELRSTMGGINLDELDPNAKRRVKRALVNLDAVIRQNGWNEDALTKEQVEARIASVAEVLPTLENDDARREYLNKLEADAKMFGLESTIPSLDEETGTVTDNTAQDAGKEGRAIPVSAATEIAAGLKFADSEEGKTFVAALGALESAWAGVPADERWDATEAVYALWEKVTKTSRLEMLKKWLEREEAKDMLVSKDEYQQLHVELETLDAQIKKLEADNKVLQGSNRTLLADQKRALASQVVLGRFFTGDSAFAKLTPEQLRGEVEKRASRGLNSLTDAVNDLMDSLPGAVKTAAGKSADAAGETESTAAATAIEISDTASLEGANEEPGEKTSTDSQAGDGTTAERPVNFPVHSRDLLRKLAAQRRRKHS
jgi:hypothetical protein